MTISKQLRADIRQAKRIVVKVGSRVLVQKSGRPEIRRLRSIVDELAALHHDGYEVVLVTSGAIGAGLEVLGLKSRPDKLPELQMAAAIGQSRLMSRYEELFSKQKCKIGQVLLTHDDFDSKTRSRNATRTINSLLAHGVIPIVNENDVVAVEEIQAIRKLGDNDLLASLLGEMIHADLLILLTTADGLMVPDEDKEMRRVSYVERITRKIYTHVKEHKDGISTGGMASKLKAVEAITAAGCPAVIANGRKAGIVSKVIEGKDVGTFFPAQS